MDIPSLPQGPIAPKPSDLQTRAREAAEAFEASFLAEMLKHTGLGDTGVAGSEAFSGFLLEAYAERLVEAGGIGVSEGIEKHLRAQMALAPPSTGPEEQ